MCLLLVFKCSEFSWNCRMNLIVFLSFLIFMISIPFTEASPSRIKRQTACSRNGSQWRDTTHHHTITRGYDFTRLELSNMAIFNTIGRKPFFNRWTGKCEMFPDYVHSVTSRSGCKKSLGVELFRRTTSFMESTLNGQTVIANQRLVSLIIIPITLASSQSYSTFIGKQKNKINKRYTGVQKMTLQCLTNEVILDKYHKIPLTAAFITDVEKLPDVYLDKRMPSFANDVQNYHKFLSNYGTHFHKVINFGGSIEEYYLLDVCSIKSYKENLTSVSQCLKIQAEVGYKLAGGGVGAEGCLHFKKLMSSKEARQQIIIDKTINIKGGDATTPAYHRLQDGEGNPNDRADWFKGVTKHEETLGEELIAITELLRDHPQLHNIPNIQRKRQALEVAVIDYINNQAKKPDSSNLNLQGTCPQSNSTSPQQSDSVSECLCKNLVANILYSSVIGVLIIIITILSAFLFKAKRASNSIL